MWIFPQGLKIMLFSEKSKFYLESSGNFKIKYQGIAKITGKWQLIIQKVREKLCFKMFGPDVTNYMFCSKSTFQDLGKEALSSNQIN